MFNFLRERNRRSIERSGGFQISFVNFDRQRALNKIDRKNDATSVFPADHNALHPLQGPTADTHAAAAYAQPIVYERHRHRYEFNNDFREHLCQQGLVVSGHSPDSRLVNSPTRRWA